MEKNKKINKKTATKSLNRVKEAEKQLNLPSVTQLTQLTVLQG